MQIFLSRIEKPLVYEIDMFYSFLVNILVWQDKKTGSTQLISRFNQS